MADRLVELIITGALLIIHRPLLEQNTNRRPVSTSVRSAVTEHEGEVRYYERGKKLAISIRFQVEVTYDLTDSHKVYVISSDLAVGDRVICSEQTREHGPTRITVTVETKRPQMAVKSKAKCAEVLALCRIDRTRQTTHSADDGKGVRNLSLFFSPQPNTGWAVLLFPYARLCGSSQLWGETDRRRQTAALLRERVNRIQQDL